MAEEFRAVYFQVTDGAQAEMMGGAPLMYVGLTYHISRRNLEEAQRVFNETQDTAQAHQIIAIDDIEPNSLMEIVKEKGYTPAPDTILERFDTIDSETGDILVLLRVPCVMAQAAGMEGMPEAA